MKKNCSSADPCYLCHIVLCEMVWVLESNYHQGKDDIVRIIEQILQTSQLEIQDPETVWNALKNYHKSNADFSDYLIAYINASKGCKTTVTFDKKAGKHKLFEYLTAVSKS